MTTKRMLLPQYMRQLATASRRGKAHKRMWRNQASKIEAFGKYLGKPLYTHSFSAQVTEEYVYYLRSNEKEYGQNTVRSFVHKLGTAIRRAGKAGFKVNLGFEEIIVPAEEPVSIALSPWEIEKIFELKGLSREAYRARERYVVACCTGFRFSDAKEIGNDNFSGGKVYMKTRKTGATVIIPQHWMVKAILKRNGGTLPPLRSQQAFNTMVKRLCRKAGIVQKILVERVKGLRVIRKMVPKYALVTCHTARRSLATNMYLAGISPARIMLITGHTTEQAFFKYIRINKTENAETLATHPFFLKQAA